MRKRKSKMNENVRLDEPDKTAVDSQETIIATASPKASSTDEQLDELFKKILNNNPPKK